MRVGDLGRACAGIAQNSTGESGAGVERIWSLRIGPVGDRSTADAAHPSTSAAVMHDSIRAIAGRLPFLAPGAGDPERAEQSDLDRTFAGADLLPYATGCDGYPT